MSTKTATATTTTATTTSTAKTKQQQQQMAAGSLLNPKTMDGPVVAHTVADLFRSHPRTFMTYHVMSAGYGALTPLGVGTGAILYYTGLYRPLSSSSSSSALANIATAGLVAGGAGLCLGLYKKNQIARQQVTAPSKNKLPWTDDGIQQRVDGLSHNFKVRVLDLSVWTGIGVATGVLLWAGGPVALGLSPGLPGILQGWSLGSAAGSVGAIGCIMATAPTTSKLDDE